jgi:hypothetical protein
MNKKMEKYRQLSRQNFTEQKHKVYVENEFFGELSIGELFDLWEYIKINKIDGCIIRTRLGADIQIPTDSDINFLLLLLPIDMQQKVKRLINSEIMLDCLEAAGVDNWLGYETATYEYYNNLQNFINNE